MSNDRINLPGGVDKVGHSSIQAWSAGALFPAVLCRVDQYSYAERPSVVGRSYRVIAYGEEWRVAFVRQFDLANFYLAYRLGAEARPIELGVHADVYDAAAQFALGLVMVHEKAKYEAEIDKMEAALRAAADKLWPGEMVIIDECSRIDPAVLEVIEMVPPLPEDPYYDPAEIESLERELFPDEIPVTPEEEAIPADYWMEKKALLCSDHPAEDPPAAETWLERRPARDCGVAG